MFPLLTYRLFISTVLQNFIVTPVTNLKFEEKSKFKYKNHAMTINYILSARLAVEFYLSAKCLGPDN